MLRNQMVHSYLFGDGDLQCAKWDPKDTVYRRSRTVQRTFKKIQIFGKIVFMFAFFINRTSHAVPIIVTVLFFMIKLCTYSSLPFIVRLCIYYLFGF
jgi:hypothetical protein